MDTCHECVNIVEKLNTEFSELQDENYKIERLKNLFKNSLIKSLMLYITNENDINMGNGDFDFDVNKYLEENNITDFDDKMDFIETLKNFIKDENKSDISEWNEGDNHIYYKKYIIDKEKNTIEFLTNFTINIPKDDSDIEYDVYDIHFEGGNLICPTSEKKIKYCVCSYCKMLKEYYEE